MTVWERIRIFPTSVSRLWKDWLLYQNIRDAAATPRNAWTIPGTTTQSATTTTTKNANNNAVDDEGRTVVSPAEVPLLVAKQMVHSHIPWRQREQQRRFLDGLSTVLPVVVLWCVPIVGYVPMLLAIAAPRQLLSRHFHNDFEAVQYNRLAYRQRHAHFAAVVQEMCSIRTKKMMIQMMVTMRRPQLLGSRRGTKMVVVVLLLWTLLDQCSTICCHSISQSLREVKVLLLARTAMGHCGCRR